MLDVTIANRCLAMLGPAQAPPGRCQRLWHLRGGGHRTCVARAHPADPGRPFDTASLQDLRERIVPWQSKARQSGALHAALALDDRGEILACREDMGRHNALDKLIGMQLRQPVQAATLVITSRCGSELIHKAVQFGAAHLISLASPASSRCDWP